VARLVATELVGSAAMSSKPLRFEAPTPARSLLFKNPSETVPPTDELEVLQAELTLLRQKSLERAKKAGEDLKTIEESMRRIKEREKGKAKAVEKVKRERGCTCFCLIVLV
jgi:transcriptional adapter 3